MVNGHDVLRRENDLTWRKEIVPRVFQIVSTRISLPQRDLITLLLTSPWLNQALVSCSSLWQVLDFHEESNAGDRLIRALKLPRYHHVRHINLEFGRIEDEHLHLLKNKRSESLQDLETLNLNVCQKISDKGIQAVTSVCPNLKSFSIYWNVRVTDLGIKKLSQNCRHLVNLNLSGCQSITDVGLNSIADNYPELEVLNLTRCTKLTDDGLQQILLKCSKLQSLNLYALSRFTDEAYKKIALLPNLKFLDLCGAQNLSDQGLSCIAECKNLTDLNLTWCVRVTDVGVEAIAQGCSSLEFLSLFGIVGVTDNCLEALSRFCSNTLTTLDVNGCIGIKRRSRDELLQLFPNLKCFKVHS
ncbi:hypothetical protein AQUCO_01400911v1 [Aquilegia coerulea]|uniref:F-box/LRR-repeat protein 15-like leucin rich repeat domain-containing protein n=1 Tax=Aquilegia coerulea TaxID=218851 RepID=A0A2G5DYR0_AQUCA|nr:hypothetical protein AQUCO_01400911v1 [Aquilegia coerulea]